MNLNIQEHFPKLFLQIALLWVFLGIVLGPLAVPLVVLHALYLIKDMRYLEAFLGFFLILILSDSRNYKMSFAADAKAVYILLLMIPFFINKNNTLDISKSLHKSFLPYIIFSFFCLIFSPTPFTAFQKTLSYLLLLITVPVIFYSLYKLYGTTFLRYIVYFGVLILIAGYLLYIINPSLVMYSGSTRSSGVFGNPNGLGIFCFLFFILYFVIKTCFPLAFSKRENFLIHVVIIASLLWSGSRGQTLSLLVFLITAFFTKQNRIVGVFITASIGILLAYIDIDIEAIAHTFGFEGFLRTKTLESGGGRVIAREFAWEQIQKNFWIGNGFSYTEFIFKENFYELSMRGHEGNAHNTFLTVWLDTGLVGLILFIIGWGVLFIRAAKNSYLAIPVAISIITSGMAESLLVASLNPYTIQVLMVLTILIFLIKKAPTTDNPDTGRLNYMNQPLLRGR